MSSPGHEWTKHEREGWSVCSRCGMVRNYDREMTTCSGALPRIAVREDNETSEGIPKFYTARTKRAVNSLTVERGPKGGAA